jgi:hypothetical protein
MADEVGKNLSGDWIGHYNYGDSQALHTMEMNLSFVDNLLSGHGIDDVGRFTIIGTHNGESCSWTKTYSTHGIEYEGSLEEGRIWGTWHVGWTRGGFMIWPRKGNGHAIEEEKPEVVKVGESFSGLVATQRGKSWAR